MGAKCVHSLTIVATPTEYEYHYVLCSIFSDIELKYNKSGFSKSITHLEYYRNKYLSNSTIIPFLIKRISFINLFHEYYEMN